MDLTTSSSRVIVLAVGAALLPPAKLGYVSDFLTQTEGRLHPPGCSSLSYAPEREGLLGHCWQGGLLGPTVLWVLHQLLAAQMAGEVSATPTCGGSRVPLEPAPHCPLDTWAESRLSVHGPSPTRQGQVHPTASSVLPR